MGRRGRPKHPDILTPREWEVLALLREGLSNEQIAERLGVSLAGAKFHVSEILSKLGVSSREEAARWSPERRPWWALTFAPVALLWRKSSVSWVSGVAAAGAAIAVAAGIGVLVWGLVRTEGDEGPSVVGADPSATNDQSQPVTSTSTVLSVTTTTPAPVASATPELTQMVTVNSGTVVGVDWSPDGSSIAFASNRAIYRADYPTFEARILASPGDQQRPFSQPRWSPDGQRLAFVGSHLARLGDSNLSRATVWLVQADGSNLRDLLPGEKAELAPTNYKELDHWLDNRTVIFYQGCGTACANPYLLDADTGELRQTVNIPGSTGAIGAGILGTIYHWSPDNRRIAVEELSLPTVLLYDRATRTALRLAPEAPRQTPWQWFNAWSPDSAAFLFQEADSDGTTFHPPFSLYVWNIASGERRLLARPGKDGVWSQNGSLLAYLTAPTVDRPCEDIVGSTTCIAVVDIATGEELFRVSGPSGPEYLSHFNSGYVRPIFLNDDRLVYVIPRGEIRAVGSSGIPRTVARGTELIREMHLSPDGKDILVVRQSSLQIVPVSSLP